MATKSEIEELQAQVARLQEALGAETQKRTQAEEMAFAMSQAGQFFGSTAEEQATGRTITVRTCLNPTERTEKKQRWHDLEVPTYFYTIQLPTAAGLCLTTNGVEYYHGQTYEFDGLTLAEMKSRVARCWDHEKSIHGDNENAYRKPTNQLFSNKPQR